MALREGRTKPFGIRRQLGEVSEEMLMEPYQKIHTDGWIPDKVTNRESLHVTLLPQRRLGRQLTRGIVAGYEFGKAIAATKREMRQSFQDDLIVTLGEVAVLKSRFIVMKIESEELSEEVAMTNMILGRFGLKGAMREHMPLHVTLGESTDLLSKNHQRTITGVLNDVMPVGDEIVLSDPEFYPVSSQTKVFDALAA